MKIVLAGLLENISTRADGSVKLTFGTQEIESKEAGELFQLRGKYSKILLSDTNVSTAEEEAVDQTYIQSGKKSKSNRLRATMFVVWNKSNFKNIIPFEQYYNDEMEKLITDYKSKIEPDPQPEENE